MAIIKETVTFINTVNYRYHSDKNKYIKNLRTGIIYTQVSTTIEDEFIELEEEIEMESI